MEVLAVRWLATLLQKTASQRIPVAEGTAFLLGALPKAILAPSTLDWQLTIQNNKQIHAKMPAS